MGMMLQPFTMLYNYSICHPQVGLSCITFHGPGPINYCATALYRASGRVWWLGFMSWVVVVLALWGIVWPLFDLYQEKRKRA